MYRELYPYTNRIHIQIAIEVIPRRNERRLMFLNEKSAEERLNSPNNLAHRLAEFRRGKKILVDNDARLINPGRQLPRLPPQVREEIKEKALSGQFTRKEIAEEYGVSSPAIGHIKKQALKEEEEKKSSAREAFLSQALQS